MKKTCSGSYCVCSTVVVCKHKLIDCCCSINQSFAPVSQFPFPLWWFSKHLISTNVYTPPTWLKARHLCREKEQSWIFLLREREEILVRMTNSCHSCPGMVFLGYFLTSVQGPVQQRQLNLLQIYFWILGYFFLFRQNLTIPVWIGIVLKWVSYSLNLTLGFFVELRAHSCETGRVGTNQSQ